MGDANHLMIAAQRLHLCANCVGDFTADVGVDLVEDEQWNLVMCGQRRFDCQHETRDFAARGDGAQRFQRLTRIGREK